MKLNDKIDFQDVGALTRRITGQKIIKPRFSLEAPVRDIANAIYAAMKAEVGYRHRRLILDPETREHIMHAARWLSDPQGKFGLMLMGTCGNGKTTLMNAIARLIAYTTETVCGYSRRKQVRIITAKESARMCAADNRSGYDALFSAEMLGIDDMGAEPVEVMSYGMIHTPMIDLLTERYNRQLFTIVTTNLSDKDISAAYKERILDRIREMMEIITFTNPSYRKNDNPTT